MYTEHHFFKYLFFITAILFMATMVLGYGKGVLHDQRTPNHIILELPAPKADTFEPVQVETTSRRMQVEQKLIERYEVDEIKARELAPIYVRASRESSVSTDILLAVSWAETRFRAHLVSNTGAVGMMQVMPNWWVKKIKFIETREDLFDPTKNIRAGAQILAECAERFGMKNAFRCYHGGPGGVYRPKESTIKYTALVSYVLERTHEGAF